MSQASHPPGGAHRLEAERLVNRAHYFTYGDGADPVAGAALAAEAQVYATLALVDVTAQAGASEKDTREGESTGELTIFRASHESIVMGHYTTREAAKAHCEAKVWQEEPAGSIRHLSWSADDIGDQAEYELHVTPDRTGGLIRGTGYVVTPLTVASEYDEEADE